MAIFLVMTVTEIINVSLDRQLNAYGILPRSPDHWLGILAAPFLHGSATHYVGNIVPLIVLSFFSMQHGILRFLLVSSAVIVGGGSMVWLFGRPAVHIGASGLIYGYLGFLLVAGFISREFRLMVISVIVWVLYGSAVYGILPTQPHVSFESHFFGFVVGALVGYRWGGVRQTL